MDLIHSSVKWESALADLDDIVIFSKSFEEYMQHFEKVRTLLRDGEVTLNIKTFSFFAE